MFNIDATELIFLIVLGVVMFGPEKLPAFARKAARVFVAVRDIANNAQTSLRNELGPEYSDLKLQDLNPKSFVAKHMRDEIAAIEDAKRELNEATQSLRGASAEAASAANATSNATAVVGAASETEQVEAPQEPELAAVTGPASRAPYDPEAT